MSRDILKLLQERGKRGISFFYTDKNLPAVRKEVQQLRKQNYVIKETLEGGSFYTFHSHKQARFVLEDGK